MSKPSVIQSNVSEVNMKDCCSNCGAELGKEPHTKECNKLFFKKMDELDELWKKERA